METNIEISDQKSRHLAGLIIALSIATTFFACGPAYVTTVPPPPVYVRPAAPYAGAVWIEPGYRYSHGTHVYINGYWARPRAGRVYYPGEWRSAGPRGYYYHRGGWR